MLGLVRLPWRVHRQAGDHSELQAGGAHRQAESDDQEGSIRDRAI
jgi:hypothetical protein